MDEGANILVIFCINKLDNRNVIKQKVSHSVQGSEERYTVSKFTREVTMKIAIKDRKKFNITAHCEKLNTVKEEKLMRRIACHSTLFRSVI